MPQTSRPSSATSYNIPTSCVVIRPSSQNPYFFIETWGRCTAYGCGTKARTEAFGRGCVKTRLGFISTERFSRLTGLGGGFSSTQPLGANTGKSFWGKSQDLSFHTASAHSFGPSLVPHVRKQSFDFVNGRVKVSQRAAQNVATLGLARSPGERALASGRPRFS
jgi:hypothetical protein